MTVAKQIECPSCGAKLKGGDGDRVSCEFCGADLELQAEGKSGGWDPPLFRRRPIPCPSCSKKALRPRIRTKDFRCQACSAVYPGQEIEKRIERLNWRDDVLVEAPKKIAPVVRAILRRSAPEFARFPTPAAPPAAEAGSGSPLTGFLGLATIVAAFFILGGLPIGARIALAIVAGVAVAFTIVMLETWSHSSKVRAEAAEREARLRPQTEWDAANPAVAKLRDEFYLLGFDYSLKGTACSDEQLADATWVEHQYADPTIATREPTKHDIAASDNAIMHAFEPADSVRVLAHCRHPAQRWAVHRAQVANPVPPTAKQGTSRAGLVALMFLYDQLARIRSQKDVVVPAVTAAGTDDEKKVVKQAYADLEEARGIT